MLSALSDQSGSNTAWGISGMNKKVNEGAQAVQFGRALKDTVSCQEKIPARTYGSSDPIYLDLDRRTCIRLKMEPRLSDTPEFHPNF